MPVLRARRRYMAFELEAEGEIQARDLMARFIPGISLFGDAGVAKIGSS